MALCAHDCPALWLLSQIISIHFHPRILLLWMIHDKTSMRPAILTCFTPLLLSFISLPVTLALLLLPEHTKQCGLASGLLLLPLPLPGLLLCIPCLVQLASWPSGLCSDSVLSERISWDETLMWGALVASSSGWLLGCRIWGCRPLGRGDLLEGGQGFSGMFLVLLLQLQLRYSLGDSKDLKRNEGSECRWQWLKNTLSGPCQAGRQAGREMGGQAGGQGACGLKEPWLLMEPGPEHQSLKGSCLNKFILRRRWGELHARDPRGAKLASIAEVLLLEIKTKQNKSTNPEYGEGTHYSGVRIWKQNIM